ncbi:MAG: hypothetical protein Q7U41_00895 [Microbacterium sp.]|nr:hypothetical protein [Microbacterium sp.]
MSRWERLFDDLESQLESELSAEHADLAAEEERLRIGRIGLRGRLAASIDSDAKRPLRLSVLGRELVVIADALGRDWVSGREQLPDGRPGDEVVVPLAAIDGALWSPHQVDSTLGAAPTASLSARIGLAFALRDLCRRRVAVHVHTREATRHGTIDRVGRDHFDLAEHPVGSLRRSDAVTGVRTMRFEHVGLVRYPA